MLHDLAEQAALIWAQHNALSQLPVDSGNKLSHIPNQK